MFHTLLLVLALILVFWTALLYLPVPAPFGFAVLLPRVFGGALSLRLAVIGGVGAVVAFIAGSSLAGGIFTLATLLALIVVRRIAAVQGDFAAAFGPDWEQRVAADRRQGMLPHRWLLKAPAPPDATWQQDVPFWTIPETGRKLLCDMWQPPTGVKRSGLAYIYFHGSAWYILDKDAYTRTFFRHLTAQGHVVMDVAYRLYPETDVPGMVGDVKRAIAWLKANAAAYGVNPDRIVIGGSSAGGHMSQLAGFAPDHPELTPADVQGHDLQVAGIISCYGPSDLVACFHHTNQHKLPQVGATPPDLTLLQSPAPPIFTKLFGKDAARMGYHKMAVAGRLDWLMGGTPTQVPERYALCSPINHVHAKCPPTLLLQGEDDLITSAKATRELHQKLVAAGVPVINMIYPHTDHMFDLMPLSYSISAQSATYAIERFLAVLAADSSSPQLDQVAG